MEKYMRALPTKKFFITLFFLILVASGGFELFQFLKQSTGQNTNDQKIAVTQNEFRQSENTSNIKDFSPELQVATSSVNAIAAVIYLREQAKINGATMEETTSKIGAQIEEAKQKLDTDTYAKKDIIISSDNSPEMIKKYGNDMATIFINASNQYHSDETYLMIVKNAFMAKDAKELKKLDPYIHFYEKVISDSLAISVPSSAVSVHLGLMNTYAEIFGLIKGFQTTFNDLPSAVASNSRLEKSSARFTDSFKNTDSFFKEKGVAFLSGEKGSLFSIIASGYIKQ